MATAQSRRGSGTGGRSSGKPRQRILRIGILLGDTFIEEKLVRDRKTVTIGQSHKATFVVPVDNLPKTFPLFALDGNGQYHLNFTEDMDGRVAIGGKPRLLASLKGKEAKRSGNHYTLPMQPNARGKIELGEMRLLFQFVVAPPLQPRPRLPASVRGSIADRIDPHLAIILAISLLVHFTIGAFAWNHDKTVERRAERFAREFRADLYEEEIFKQPTVETTGEETTTGGETASNDKPSPKNNDDKNSGSKQPDDSGGGDDGGAPDDAAIAEQIQAAAIMGILGGGTGEDGRYSKTDDVDQGAGLDEGIKDIKQSGKGVRGRGTAGDGRPRGPNSGKIGKGSGKGGIDGPKGDGSGGGPVKETKIKSRTSLGSIDELSDGTLDPNSVIRRIRQRYLRQLKACHETALKTNPRLGGRVQLRFTVGPTGRVTRASAKGFDPSVDSCIKSRMRKWRFGAPKDEDGKPSSAQFSIPVVLKAGG